MKKVVFWMMAALLVATAAVSCKSTLPGRFESFVDQVEKKSANYSDDEWTKADAKFDQLKEEYDQKKSSLKPDEKDRIEASISQYKGLKTSKFVKKPIDWVEKSGKKAGNWFKALFGLGKKDSKDFKESNEK